MISLVIASLATAFVLTAVEELLMNLGKYRGLLAFLVSLLGAYFTDTTKPGMLIFTGFAAAFAGITLSVSVVSLLESRDPRIVRRLPRRVPPL
jgi:hypothetical protein